MGSKLADKAVVHDQDLNSAFRQGVVESASMGNEYRVLLYVNHTLVDEKVFAYLDGAMAWAAAHLQKGEGHTIRAECRSTSQVAVGPAPDEDIVDAEIVE